MYPIDWFTAAAESCTVCTQNPLVYTSFGVVCRFYIITGLSIQANDIDIKAKLPDLMILAIEHIKMYRAGILMWVPPEASQESKIGTYRADLTSTQYATQWALYIYAYAHIMDKT